MRFRQRRKAISYILSVAIMAFVTVSLASVVLYWSIGEVTTSQNIFAVGINGRIDKTQERFTIEQVAFLANGESVGTSAACSSANGCLMVYVRNVGATQVVIDAVYIDAQLATQGSYLPSKLSLGIQQVGSIMVQSPSSLSLGTTYSITVASTRGNTVIVSQTY